MSRNGVVVSPWCSVLILFALLSQRTTRAEELIESPPWTLLIYGAVDNNADGPIFGFLEDIHRNYDPKAFRVVVFLDRSKGFSDAPVGGEDFTDARLFTLQGDDIVRVGGGESFPEITTTSNYEANSGDPETLRKFIAFGKESFPAMHYGLIIYSHADGRAMCPDEDEDAEMGIAALTDELSEDEAVDFTALELCSMGGIEIAYQWRPGNGGFFTETLVAIPNAGPPLDWSRIMRRIRVADSASESLDPQTMTATDLARLVVAEGGAGRRQLAEEHPEMKADWQWEAVSAYDLWVTEEVKEAVDDLALALVATNGRQALESLRGPDQATKAMTYAPKQTADMPYFDLYDLARRIADCSDLDESVRTAAVVVMDTVDEMVIDSFAMTGYDGFEPGHHGVYIVFPQGDVKEDTMPHVDRRWEVHCWYSPIEPPSKIRTYGRWAWCADGAEAGNHVVENWFEMLDSWYDDPSVGHGGINEYEW